MSYTSSDPENLYRDPDTISLASTSTTTSQLSKSSKKKPWSKLKSGIKSIGRKMSTGSKPTFAEPTESSEQKKVKKNKKFKESGSGGSSEATPSSTEGNREKSPTKGSKSFIKKLSVESISTPFVGYQPSSVSPTRSYAKALYKSASTSESNLSTSDLDTPKKSSTLDRNTRFNMESPDSGRVSRSQGESSSRPPSQITEEGYVSNSDTDITTSPSVRTEPLGLVAKTQHFAQTVIPPKQDKDVAIDFIKAETVAKPPKSPSTNTATSESSKNSKSKVTENQIPPHNPVTEKDLKSMSSGLSKESIENNEFPAIDEVEGRKKNKRNKKQGNASASFISSEKSENNVPVLSQTRPLLVKEEVSAGSNTKDQDSKTSNDFLNKETTLAAESKQFENIDNSKESVDKVRDTSQKAENVAKSGPASEDKNSNKERSNKQKDSIEVKSVEKDPLKEISNENKLKTSSDGKEAKSEGNPPVNKEKQDIKGDRNKKESQLKKEDNTVKSSKDGEKKKSSRSSKDESEPSLATPTPVDDFGPSTPSTSDEKLTTQMSVEEKLEAFLSAEGWSGTIKDIADKSAEADETQQVDKRECLYKILVIGELGTGKTSIIKRYVHQFFSQHYRATIGVDFALKVLNWDTNTIIRLQLWDIAGQERFGNMTRVYYKEAVGAFIVFDVTRSATFDAVLKWKQDLDSKVQLADGSPIPCVLLANKCDQQKEGLVNTPSKMDEYCKENNFSAWFETSAKENINIDDAARSLVSQILQNDRMSQNGRDSMKDGSKFPLENKPEEEGRTCSC